MKSMKPAMSKGALLEALTTSTEVKKIRVLEITRLSGNNCNNGSEESGCFHYPRPLQDQDAPQTSDQGRETRNFRQDANRESKACQDDCESVPRGRFEEQLLIIVGVLFAQAFFSSWNVDFMQMSVCRLVEGAR